VSEPFVELTEKPVIAPAGVVPAIPVPTSASEPFDAIVYWLTLFVAAFAVYANRPSEVTTSQHAAP
jgi:hypothetical protein